MTPNILEEIEKQILAFWNLEQIQTAKGQVVAYWKTVPDGSVEAKKCAAVYAKLMMREKTIKVYAPAGLDLTPPMTTQVLKVYGKLVLEAVLPVPGDIDDMVKTKTGKTVTECLMVAFAKIRQHLTLKAAQELSAEDLPMFEQALDQCIAAWVAKIADPPTFSEYEAAFNLARDKYWVAAGKKAAATKAAKVGKGKSTPAVATPTNVKKAVSIKILENIEDAMVTVPKNSVFEAARGRKIARASQGVMEAYAQFQKTEQQAWADAGIEFMDFVARHNFFTILLTSPEPATKGIKAIRYQGQDYALDIIPDGVAVTRLNEIIYAPTAGAV